MRVLMIACLLLVGKAWATGVPQEGLVAYFPLDGNAIDESGNGHGGTLIGGVLPATDRTGRAGRALFFDGLSGRVDVPHSPALDYVGSDSMTVSVWAKLADPIANLGPILCKGGTPGDDSGGSSYCLPFSAEGRLLAYINHFPNGQPFSGLESETVLVPGIWTHLVVRFAGAEAAIFVNAVSDAATTFTSAPVLNSDPLHIGLDADGLDEYLHGTLDDLCIYDRALSLPEIEALYTGTVGVESATWGRIKRAYGSW